MQCNLAFEFLRRFGTPTVRMRYESLAADPRGELERMFARLGEPGQHDLSAIGPTRCTWPGSTACAATRCASPTRQQVRPDEAWRTGMARKTRSIVVLVTWPLLLRYGYLRPRDV